MFGLLSSFAWVPALTDAEGQIGIGRRMPALCGDMFRPFLPDATSRMVLDFPNGNDLHDPVEHDTTVSKMPTDLWKIPVVHGCDKRRPGFSFD